MQVLTVFKSNNLVLSYEKKTRCESHVGNEQKQTEQGKSFEQKK